jgi:glycosyltransferase involved in cell wall biosynthesis
MKPTAIDQFHSGSSYGDAVTNSMFFIQKLLRNAGYISRIYVEHIADELKDKLISYKYYAPGKNQILLIHHSFGHDLDDWLKNLKDYNNILIYHNITPESYFPKESSFYHYSIKGREQLKLLKNIVIGAIGVSELNSDELRKLEYKNVQTIPLLIDIEKVFNIKWNPSIFENNKKAFNILYVGRIVENKCHQDLIEIYKIFTQMSDRDSKLILVGDISSKDYNKRLYELIDKYRLQNRVIITGKISDEDLIAYYKVSDVFLSMSEHEGFGVPLIEAMLFDVPVVAYNSSNIKNTLNGAGILFKEKNYEYIAGFLTVLSKNKVLRRKILKRQREVIKNYSYNNIKNSLFNFFNSTAIEVNNNSIHIQDLRYIKYQIEGPFDSSYSLALVNREMALALDNLHTDKVSLFSTEGTGNFEPNKDFLEHNHVIKKLWMNSKSNSMIDVIMRNLYPPGVNDMRGYINMLHSYGWEESAFPEEYVQNFNSYLDGITVNSSYVKKILIDNGVSIPVYITSLGADHVLKVTPQEYNGCTGKGFKFLHISSGFPRKGIDILLKAYLKTFSSKHDVTLIIKTFPNIHNKIEEEIKHIKYNNPDCPEIILINKDLDHGYIVDLYKKCNALVAPGRGEGFGLPMAEAMLLDIPVITTAYGGQTDFCTEETAWLIDYKFSKAKTHFGLDNSVWVEPDAGHLAKLMKEITELPREKIKEKTQRAKRYILNNFKWIDCARRFEESKNKIQLLPLFNDRKIRLGLISTWNSKCGIAEYSKHLMENLNKEFFDSVIFASSIERTVKNDEKNVIRCWEDRFNNNLSTLIDNILRENIDLLLIQFNFGFFEIQAFSKMLDLFKEKGIKIFITFHSTADVNIPELNISLSWIKESLKKADRLFVHNISDLNRFKSFDLINNVTLLPHGVLNRNVKSTEEMKKYFGFSGKTVISSYGFLLPHKGIKELIQAFHILQKEYSNLHLLLVNALYANPVSDSVKTECNKVTKELNLSCKITMINDFLENDEALTLLECSDMIVFPYQNTQESSSASVRFGLATNKPVICTPLDIFNDVEDAVHFLPGNTPEEIAMGIGSLLYDRNVLNEKIEMQKKWIKSHRWDYLGQRLSNLILFFVHHK